MTVKNDLRLRSSYTEWEWMPGKRGHCGLPTNFAMVGSCVLNKGDDPRDQTIFVCSGCQGINVIVNGARLVAYPAPRPGRDIEGLPGDVAAAWNEARSCLGVSATTACEHMCRKILIHIAMQHDPSRKRMTFQEAVEHLLTAGVITAQWRPWVDQIRLNGNEAAHELEPVTMERAQHTLEFTQQLLQLVYETEHRMKKFEPAK